MKQLIFAILILIVTVPLAALAQQPAGIQTFHDLPGLSNVGNMTTQQYIEALYTLAITIAAILAVFKLMWAGVQYMLSEVVTKKESAKKDIRNALLGLVIILVAVTLLNAINPNLTNLNFLRNAAPTKSLPGSGAPAAQLWQEDLFEATEVEAAVNRCTAAGGSPNKVSLNIEMKGGTRVTCYNKGSEPVDPTSVATCTPPQTRVSSVNANGVRTYTCSTEVGGSKGDLIPGGSGTQTQILDKFTSMAEYETWCAGKGGNVVTDDTTTPLTYSCRRR